jgi:hypothetical protein
MNKLKTIALISYLLISMNNNLLGQESKNRWYLIQDVEDRIVYIDTSNIELTDDRLFTRNIIMYREPIFMHTQQNYVKKIKSHLLMDIEQKTYSVIGAIFYDADDKVIGESADILSSGGSSNFSLKIQPNSVFELILDKSIEYLNTGRITVDVGEYAKKKSQEILAKIPEPEETLVGQDTLALVTEKTDSLESTALIKETPPVKETIKTVTEPIKDIAVKTPIPEVAKPEIPKTKKPSNDLIYDSSKDKVASGLIFTDGKLYCIQVSSWRTKSIAEKEVAKLIKKGHVAFIVSAFIPSKNATWHRVRVGSFKSLHEAKIYQSNL